MNTNLKVLTDKRLSWAAKGLMFFASTLPEAHRPKLKTFARLASEAETPASLNSIICELQSAGYLGFMPAPEASFQEFWKAYPRKVGKGKAELIWAKMKCARIAPQIIAAVEAQKRMEQWKKDGGQFIPHPATWLNQKRWEDEVKIARTGNNHNI